MTEWFEEVQKIIPKLLPQATVDYTGGCTKCKKFVRGGKNECDTIYLVVLKRIMWWEHFAQ